LRRLDAALGPAGLRLLGALRGRRPRPAEPRRIGLMKTTGIGDVILLSAVARDVIESWPEAEVFVITGPENASLVELIAGARPVTLPTTQPHRVLASLRALRLDVLVDYGQWTRVEALYSCLSGARWTAGFRTAGQRRHAAYDATVEHRDDVPELDNFRALTARLGVQSTAEPHFEAREEVPSQIAEPYVVLHMWPGGFRSELREWPSERWRELATALASDGFQIVLSGGPGDRERSQQFVSTSPGLAGQVIDLSGRHRLSDLVGLLAGARAVISVNTGIMHLAAATGVPTIALNGPTSSLRWGARGPRVVNLDSELPGCGFLNLGFEYDGRRLDCMTGISVERVLGATREHAYA
jgi:heptosyltransferase-3